ncbi:MAG: hypothetical protein C0404_14865 [Verrucomicrobia bacterium]|nr:hypothetical protein [Verrucomicrobiota bacterium]
MKPRKGIAVGFAVVHGVASLALWLYILVQGMMDVGSSSAIEPFTYVAMVLWFPSVLLGFFQLCNMFTLPFSLVLIANSALWGYVFFQIISRNNKPKPETENT